KTVLVFGNGREKLASTAKMLEGTGYDVHFEPVVGSCLHPAGAAPRLIISELAVPGVDGLQLCRQVRQNEILKNTPVVLIGDLSRESSIVGDSFRCGATEYVQRRIDQFKFYIFCRDIL